MKDKTFQSILNESAYGENTYNYLTVKELIEELQKYPGDAKVELVCFKKGSLMGGCEGYGYAYKVSRDSYGEENVVIRGNH